MKLKEADLRGVDLSGARMAFARLDGADLRGANLRGAQLVLVVLRGADLRGADLTGANLWRAELVDIQWEGATCPDARPSPPDGCAFVPEP